MDPTNAYCEALRISVPRLERAMESPDANYYSLLVAALLEKGGPMTLEEAANRFEKAGLAPAHLALASLKRCQPARPPIYRDGNLYALDPHDDEAGLWAFRLGLKPPKVPLRLVRPEPAPLRRPHEPVTPDELDEGFRQNLRGDWSGHRLAILILDAHGSAMQFEDIFAFLRSRQLGRRLTAEDIRHWGRSAVRVRADGAWELDAGHPAVASARAALRERIAMERRWAQMRTTPPEMKLHHERLEREREANADRLAAMSRVIVHGFPRPNPLALVLLDAKRREIGSFMGPQEIADARAWLAAHDMIAGLDIRALLRALAFEPGERRLGELGPPQKTKRLNRSGRTLKITTTLLIQGSCGISRPLAEEETLRGYMDRGESAKLRRRLEADAKSLLALYQYGRLHGAVRLRWGFLDERLPAPWVHRDERTIHHLMQRALRLGQPLEVVIGTAPGWTDPWSRAQLAHVMRDETGWRPWLLADGGWRMDTADVQLARLAPRVP